jgi:hypothetical protein
LFSLAILSVTLSILLALPCFYLIADDLRQAVRARLPAPRDMPLLETG